LVSMADRNPNDLSGGEQQSLAIAGLLAMKPRVMAFDEPVSMLDPIGKTRVMEIMRQITLKENTTSLATESGADIESIAEVVDHILLFDNGKLLMSGQPRDVLQSDIVESVGVGRPQVTDIFLALSRRGHHFDYIPITLEEARSLLDQKLISAGVTKISRPLERISQPEMPAGETVIEVKNLHHIYNREVHALKGVSMEITKGQIVGIIGQNGSGKTTLARHLVGLLKPTNKDATLRVNGKDITKLRINEIIKMINYVFQNPDDQLFAETIWEEIAFAPKMMDLDDAEVNRLTEEAMEVFGLDKYQKRYVYSLDEDLKTYLAISCILPLHPEILLIDEPTTGLDTLGEIKMMGSLRRLRDEQGKTIIIITHNMKTIGNHCDRVIVMNDGNIVLDGTPREVFIQRDKLLEADILPPQVTRLGQGLTAGYGCPQDILTVEEMVEILDYSLKTRESS
jgi:energy-coupling factor transport system ATP-binding protein